MGNTFPKCPTPFQSVGNLACIMPCPSEKGYQRTSVNSGFQCTYTADPKRTVLLNTVAAVPFTGSTMEDLQKVDQAAFSGFTKERDRFMGELVILDGKIGKDVKLRDAFQKLQDAENVRDEVPNAYQQARNSYYTLKEGETWKEKEKQRLLKAEVQPVINKLLATKSNALRQYDNQRKTVDVVNGLKDRVLSLKDEVKYAADTFKEQLGKVQGAINRERRDRVQETTVSIWDWLDILLNGAIICSLLYVIYLLFKKFSSTRAVAPRAYSLSIQ